MLETTKKAHESSIRGVASDALNLTTITCSANGEVSFWPFKHKSKLTYTFQKCTHQIKIEEFISKIALHRERLFL